MPVQLVCPNPRCGVPISTAELDLAQGPRCPRCGQALDLAFSGAAAGAASPPVAGQSTLAEGASFGRYTIVRRLGAGGMGTVYLAHDSSLDRRVALKIPYFSPHDSPEALERFQREAKAAAALDHPNLCAVYDIGQIDGAPYMTMAYVEGRPLSDLIDGKGPIPSRQAAALVRKLALALQAAHDRGVIHRDLKPANILINRQRELVIVDFGLARREGVNDVRLTRTGVILGTPAYMSPEQVAGDATAVGAGADLYSLGVILYELLAGRVPFEGPVALVLGQIMMAVPEPPSRYRPEIDPKLEAICLKALAKRPADRYASMNELAATLTEYLRVGAPASPSVIELPVVTADPPAPQPTRGESLVGQLLARLKTVRDRVAATPPEKRLRHRVRAWSSRAAAFWRDNWGWLAAGGIPLLVFLCGIALYVQTNHGTVKIALSDPKADVTVRLDGEKVVAGRVGAPLRLRVGDHRLEVTGDAFTTKSEEFTLRRGESKILEVALVPQPPPRASEYGTVKIVLSEPAADVVVKVDGDTIAPERRNDPIRLRIGTHEIQAFGPDYETTIEPISIKHGEARVAGITLVRKRASNAGTLAGWKALSGSWRMENGSLVGSAPQERPAQVAYCSPEAYGDFELRFEARLEGGAGSGGVRFRAEIANRANSRLNGPLLSLPTAEPLGPAESTASRPQDEIAKLVLTSTFNSYAIRCVGKHVTIERNFLTVVDKDVTWMPAEGFVAFQLQGGRPEARLTLKDVSLVRLTPSSSSKADPAVARRQAYADRMAEAQRLIDDGNIARAEPLLRDCPEDLRGWEWRFCVRQCSLRRKVSAVPDRERDQRDVLVIFHPLGATAFAFSPYGYRLASGNAHEVVLWDVTLGNPKSRLETTGFDTTRRLSDLTFSPDGKRIAGCSEDGSARIWSDDTFKVVQVLPGSTPLYCLKFDPAGRRLATGDKDGNIRIWPVTVAQEVRSMRGGHSAEVRSLQWAPDGNKLVSGGADGTVKIWDPDTGRRLASIDAGGAVRDVALSPDGQHLAVASDRGDLTVWEMDAKLSTPVRRLPAATCFVDFSPDGQRLVTGRDQLWIWDARTERALLRLRVADGDASKRLVYMPAFSPDGERLGVLCPDGLLRIWSAQAPGNSEAVFQPLFNGKDLTGWEGLRGYWTVRDGAIIGASPRDPAARTFLCSTRSFRDFELRFKARLKDGIGNSGVQFRSRVTDYASFKVQGPQCAITPPGSTPSAGSVVTEPNGPMIAGSFAKLGKVYDPKGFNSFSIRCVGRHVTIKVNGVTTVDSDVRTMPDQGVIAWQIDSRYTPREVAFKDIEIADLTPSR